MATKKKKVLLGMSGGVDSSVSAVLLLEQGYEVIGAFMKNWSNCEWRADRRDAMRVAAQLGIPFVTLDFEKEYREKVVKNLFEEYAAGRTPNPDVLCNKYVKFDLFVKAADELGCEFVATGHYAEVEDGDWRMEDRSLGRSTLYPLSSILRTSKDTNKDQTYFLWAMPRDVLSRVLFPVGGLLKSEVREIARRHHLSVAEKKDSVGICFVGEVDVKEFLKQRIPPNPGPIVTTDGRTVGEHEGLAFYTIGQREGIGSKGGGTPWYVVGKEKETNTLVVGSEVDARLFSSELEAKDVNWLADPARSGAGLPPLTKFPTVNSGNLSATASARLGASVEDGAMMFPPFMFPCLARIRYRQPLEACRVEVREGGEKIHVTFDRPQRAVTPGQSIVLYTDDGVVLGGAIIQQSGGVQ